MASVSPAVARFRSLPLSARLAHFGVFGASPRLRRIAFLRCRCGVFLSGSVLRCRVGVSRFSSSSVSVRVSGAGGAPASVVASRRWAWRRAFAQ